MQKGNETLQKGNESLQKGNEALKKEHEALQKEHETLQKEHETLKKEHDECDASKEKGLKTVKARAVTEHSILDDNVIEMQTIFDQESTAGKQGLKKR